MNVIPKKCTCIWWVPADDRPVQHLQVMAMCEEHGQLMGPIGLEYVLDMLRGMAQAAPLVVPMPAVADLVKRHMTGLQRAVQTGPMWVGQVIGQNLEVFREIGAAAVNGSAVLGDFRLESPGEAATDRGPAPIHTHQGTTATPVADTSSSTSRPSVTATPCGPFPSRTVVLTAADAVAKLSGYGVDPAQADAIGQVLGWAIQELVPPGCGHPSSDHTDEGCTHTSDQYPDRCDCAVFVDELETLGRRTC